MLEQDCAWINSLVAATVKVHGVVGVGDALV